MRIETNARVVYDHIAAVSEDAAQGTLQLVQKKLRALPLAKGTLASTYRLERIEVTPELIRYALASDSPYAGVIERGGWIMGGRGPHVSGSGKGRHILRDTSKRDWGRRLAKGLRAL